MRRMIAGRLLFQDQTAGPALAFVSACLFGQKKDSTVIIYIFA